jgi:hypothetical protein
VGDTKVIHMALCYTLGNQPGTLFPSEVIGPVAEQKITAEVSLLEALGNVVHIGFLPVIAVKAADWLSHP